MCRPDPFISLSVKIMPLKVLGSDGRGNFAAYFNALAYAANNGVHVTNASLGGIVSGSESSYYHTLYDSAGTGNMLNVVAAGNEGLNIDKDSRFWVPAEINRSNLITVGATDHKDSIASFSNFGNTSVDLTAPGVDILSTTWGGSTGYKSGTSMATPHAAGVAALVLSRYPSLIGNPDAVKSRIESGVDHISSHGNIRTGGRLNAYNAVY
jgi:subtilisin family serine protease